MCSTQELRPGSLLEELPAGSQWRLCALHQPQAAWGCVHCPQRPAQRQQLRVGLRPRLRARCTMARRQRRRQHCCEGVSAVHNRVIPRAGAGGVRSVSFPCTLCSAWRCCVHRVRGGVLPRRFSARWPRPVPPLCYAQHHHRCNAHRRRKVRILGRVPLQGWVLRVLVVLPAVPTRHIQASSLVHARQRSVRPGRWQHCSNRSQQRHWWRSSRVGSAP